MSASLRKLLDKIKALVIVIHSASHQTASMARGIELAWKFEDSSLYSFKWIWSFVCLMAFSPIYVPVCCQTPVVQQKQDVNPG